MTYGWIGKIVRVDLSSARTEVEDTSRYAEKFIGGRGIAAAVAWNELHAVTDPFMPENRLIFMTGPLTGTLAPASGRTAVCGVAPQTYPTPWFTRSNMGGQWGSELKYAGFDGAIIQGKAQNPVYVYINDGQVEVKDAKDLWGLDTYSTQRMIWNKHGRDVRAVCIGPAGERLVRIAVILTETESAAGQGGFGAVMGSKNLKAIAVHGTGHVKIARPDELIELCLKMKAEMPTAEHIPIKPSLNPEHVALYGQRLQNCSHACFAQCPLNHYYESVPGVVSPDILSGQFHCIAPVFAGAPKTFYDWNPGFREGFEAAVLSNKYGINQWELIIGTVPWLRAMKQQGILTDLDGVKIDPNNPEFWYSLIKKIAYRDGTIGNALAEGGLRAADILKIGKKEASEFWVPYGYPGHWDGRGDRINPIFFPVWVVAAIQLATDTRDPFSSSHGYVAGVSLWSNVLKWDDIYRISEKLYGSDKAVNLQTPYEFKAQPAIWHQHRSVLKDSLPLCDWAFPRIYSLSSDDHYVKINTSKGTVDGASFEHRLFTAVTGMDVTQNDLDRVAERIFNLERGIQVRSHGRSRKEDEYVIPYFETPEHFVGPSGKHESLDRGRFVKLMDEYYDLRGWNSSTGRPTKQKLAELALDDVSRELEKLDLI